MSVAGETSGRTAIAVPVNNSEPKSILPEILPEPEQESEQVLPDINLPVSPPSLNEDISIQEHESEASTIQIEQEDQEPHNSGSESSRVVATDDQCKPINYESPSIQEYVHRYEQEDDSNKVILPEVSSTIAENETEETTSEKVPCDEEINENAVPAGTSSPIPLEEEVKDSAQPEVEQLERLLITIMESEFNNESQKESNFENDRSERK